MSRVAKGGVMPEAGGDSLWCGPPRRWTGQVRGVISENKISDHSAYPVSRPPTGGVQ